MELPRTSKGNTGILVIVDCFSKMVHFIITQPELNAFTARILFENIITKHGIPTSVVRFGDLSTNLTICREAFVLCHLQPLR